MNSQHRIERLTAMLEEQPNDSFLLFALAKEYEASGLDDKARTNYVQLLSNDPEYIGAYYHLADLHIRLKEFSEAASVINKGVALADSLKDSKNKAELMQLRELL